MLNRRKRAIRCLNQNRQQIADPASNVVNSKFTTMVVLQSKKAKGSEIIFGTNYLRVLLHIRTVAGYQVE